MKVVFNGQVEIKKSGCNCHGNRNRKRLVYRKEFILPSGKRIIFRKGVPQEVSDNDGEFLLSLGTFEAV